MHVARYIELIPKFFLLFHLIMLAKILLQLRFWKII